MIKAKLLAGCGGLPKDAYFRNVTLLLHGDGSNGAQNNTFLDSSSNNFTVTRNGNTTQGSFSPYGTRWSNYLTTNSFITLPDSAALQLGAGDFCVEAWVSMVSLASASSPILTTCSNTVGAGGINFAVKSDGSLELFDYATTSLIASGGSVPIGRWTHVAATRSGSTLRLFINGAVVATGTTSSNFAGNASQGGIGSWVSNGQGFFFNGYISNLRVVKGSAVYTSAFTPPTTPLTAISGTSLLTCQSNRFRDASSNNFAITRNGNVRVSPFSPYAPTAPYSAGANGGSMYFDGSGDWLTGSSSMIPATSTSTFTIEGWVYPTTFANRIDVIGDMSPSFSSDVKVTAAEVNTSGQVVLYWYDGGIRRCTGSTSMVLNQWNYFAIVVSNNAIAIYVNRTTADTLSGTTTLTNRTQAHNFALGSYYGEPAFNGYLSNIRVSTVARTISAVPTAPLSSDANTRLLLNGTNAAIVDSAADNNLETVGNAQISTSVKKFGTGSIFINGSGNYLTAPNSDLYAFGTGDFTVECWFKSSVSSQNTHATMLGCYQSSVNGTWALKVYNNVAAFASFSNNTWYDWNTSTNVVADQQWHHIAATRSGTTLRVFVDGVVAGTWSSVTNNLTTAAGHPLTVGWMQQDTASPLQGYLDDIRITKGVARYTANFTPPTAAFADQ